MIQLPRTESRGSKGPCTAPSAAAWSRWPRCPSQMAVHQVPTLSLKQEGGSDICRRTDVPPRGTGWSREDESRGIHSYKVPKSLRLQGLALRLPGFRRGRKLSGGRTGNVPLRLRGDLSHSSST